MSFRRIASLALLLAVIAVAGWTFSQGQLPPADFTFCNGTDIKTIDPATVTGQPEGRVVDALFEGLCRRHPETLQPIPGIAASWRISDDLNTYTFELRRDAKWSDGSDITAVDVFYSLQRFLHPETAAEYAGQLWYVKNAKRYTKRETVIGERVEVEFPRASGVKNTARGEVLMGVLRKTEPRQVVEKDGPVDVSIYDVEIAGRVRRFCSSDQIAVPDSGIELSAFVLPSFESVGIKSDGPYRIVITLENPTPYFLDIIAFYPFGTVNKKCLETHGTPEWTWASNVVTSGPFRMEFRRLRDRIRLVKNEHYWNRDAVKLNTIDVLAVDGSATMLNMYLTGACDWVPDVPSAAATTLLRERPEEFHPKPILGTYFYRFNVKRKQFADPRVRRALTISIDRRTIVDSITKTGQVPAYSLVPPGIVGYEPDEFERGDMAEAKRLLAEAGYPGGAGFPTFELLYNEQESHKLIAEFIQDRWKRELGISVGLKSLEWATYLDTVRKGSYDMARAGWIGDYADPNTFLDLFERDNENNQTNWSDPAYDKLIAAAAGEADASKRFGILRDAEKLLMRELPIAPVYFNVSKDVVQTYVGGFHSNLRDEHPLWALSIDQAAKARAHAAKGRL